MPHFTLLGTFRVFSGGVPVKVALPRNGVALLAQILLHGDALLPRERVSATLWPDAGESEGRAKLRRLLYVIGHAAPEAGSADWIASDTLTIGWNPAAPRTVDVEALREACAGAGEPDLTALYAGDLLAGFDEEWLQEERDRLREGFARLLERRASEDARAGRHAGARIAALELLRLEPWREDAMRIAILARVAAGDRAGAVDEFESFAARLREQFGVDPMPQTLALRALFAADAPPSPETAAAAADVPFVGRERELAILAERFRDAERGRGSLVLIGGEAGIGKTELVRRHARSAGERGGLVLRAGSTFIATRPYQPFAVTLGAAERSLPHGALTDAMRQAVERIVHGAGQAADAAANDMQSSAERRSLFDGVRATFDALAASQPLVLVLEDLHWASPDTIALLEHLARHLASSRILAIVTFRHLEIARDGPLRVMRRRLQEEGLVTTIRLGALQERDVRRYLEERGIATPPGATERYLRAGRGLPLVLAGLAEDALTGLNSEPTLPADPMPALRERVENVPPEVRTLLEIAAVAGFGFDLDLARDVSGWSEAEVERCLNLAIGRRLLRETSNGYDFAHDLFREIVYDATPRAEKTLRHALVAETLERSHPELRDLLSAELAMHYERAGDLERAIPQLVRAAARSTAAHAHDDAAAYAARAIELGAAGTTAVELLLVGARAAALAGDRVRQRAQLESALERLVPLAHVELECEVYERFVDLEVWMTNLDAAWRLAERLESLAVAAGGRWPARASFSKGYVLHYRQEYARAIPHLEAAARGFARTGDRWYAFLTAILRNAVARITFDRREMDANMLLAESQLPALQHDPEAMVLLYSQRNGNANVFQRYAEAATWAGRYVDAAVAMGDRGTIASAWMYRGFSTTMLHEFRVADRSFSRAAELFEATSDVQRSAVCALHRSLLDERLGFGERAAEAARAALEEFRERELSYDVTEALSYLARYAIAAGRLEEAESCASESLGLIGADGYPPYRGLALTVLARTMFEREAAARALPLLQESCAIADRTFRPRDAADAWVARAERAAWVGDKREQRDAYERARALMSEISESHRPAGLYARLAGAFARSGEEARLHETVAEGARIVRLQAAAIDVDVWRAAFLTKPELRALVEGGAEDERRRSVSP